MAASRKRWILLLIAVVLTAGIASSAFALAPAADDADVYAVQAMLKSIGYYDGAIDGVYGNATASAVQTYQRAAGFAVTGQVDTATLRSILGSYTRAKLNAGGATAGGTTDGAAAGEDGEAQTDHSLSQQELEMAALVNQAREQAGLPALSVHNGLSRVARVKSGDMASNNYFSHDSPTYGSPFQMMTDFGVGYSTAGENIACNQTVPRAHEALMNSPGHRANILSGDFTHIGIGIVSGGKCGAMYTQMFMKP
ncbi:CAP domain-containing protein [Paenibacillus alkalitolerans]|uniref:CAP domain-containing protein n=1 Tax=Paenibacillus alkalitolerans TaxID=2799335 RepID=UPI0018F3BDDC|nr:CAP domain-containing protein [Paenibacillus alkalitolerans]